MCLRYIAVLLSVFRLCDMLKFVIYDRAHMCESELCMWQVYVYMCDL